MACARAGACAWVLGGSAQRAVFLGKRPCGQLLLPALLGCFARMLLGCYGARRPLLAEALRRLQFGGGWRQRRVRGLGLSPTKERVHA